jgi:hypothetical protein
MACSGALLLDLYPGLTCTAACRRYRTVAGGTPDRRDGELIDPFKAHQLSGRALVYTTHPSFSSGAMPICAQFW